MPDEQKLIAAPEVVFCELGAGAALLDLGSSTYYRLNVVAAQVWDHLKEPRSIQEISNAIAAQFGADPRQCEKDIDDLLRELLELRLVQRASPT